MMQPQETVTIERIPVDQITVLNPRICNKKVFREIVDGAPPCALAAE